MELKCSIDNIDIDKLPPWLYNGLFTEAGINDLIIDLYWLKTNTVCGQKGRKAAVDDVYTLPGQNAHFFVLLVGIRFKINSE